MQALQTSVALSLQRYNDGIANYFEVLEAEQQLFPAELDLARTARDQLVAVVTLYRVLGGGWRLDVPAWSVAANERATRPRENAAHPGRIEGASVERRREPLQSFQLRTPFRYLDRRRQFAALRLNIAESGAVSRRTTA